MGNLNSNINKNSQTIILQPPAQITTILQENEQQIGEISLIENKNSIFLNKILSNIVIKREIFNKVRLLNSHSKAITVNIKEESEIKLLLNYRFKDYLKSIIILNFQNNNIQDIINLNNIIKSLELLESLEIYSTSSGNSNVVSNFKCKENQIENEKIINVLNDRNNLKEIKLNYYNYNEFLEFNYQLVESLKLNSIINFNQINLFTNLKELEFYTSFNEDIQLFNLVSLKKLTFGSMWNRQLKKDTLPCHLEELIFPSDSLFNKKVIKGVLPQSLTRLQLGSGFIDHSFSDSVLPSSLKYFITGGYSYPFQVGQLPDLIYLELGKGYVFTLPEGVLPNSLETLKIDMHWKDELNRKKLSLPNNLKKVKFSYFNNKVFIVQQHQQNQQPFIPNSVTSLQLPAQVTINENTIPSSVIKVKRIQFSNINLLPSTVQYYKFPYYTSTLFKKEGPDSIPKNLTSITFDHYYNFSLTPGIFSNNIKHLEFGKSFNQSIHPKLFPISLETLIFASNFKKPLNLSKNINLKALKFSRQYNIKFRLSTIEDEEKEVEELKDTGIESSKIKQQQQQEEKEEPITILPNSLLLLEVGTKYEQILSRDNLPECLEQLIIAGSSTQLKLPLPPKLNTIYINTTSLDNLSNYYNSISSSSTINNNNNGIDNNCYLIKPLNNKKLFKYLIKNNLI